MARGRGAFDPLTRSGLLPGLGLAILYALFVQIMFNAGVIVGLLYPLASLAFGVVGAGLGAASVASTRAGTDAALPEHRGVGSGVLTASAQIGTALGLAVLMPGSSVDFRVGFGGAAGVAVLGMVASLLLPGGRLRRAGAAGPRAAGPRARRLRRAVVGVDG